MKVIFVVALVACAGNSELDKHLAAPSLESTCYLAKHLDDARAAKAIYERFKALTTNQHERGNTAELSCISEGYANATLPADLGETAVVAQMRLAAYGTKPLYAQLAPDLQRAGILKALRDEATLADKYALKFATHELIRLGAPPETYVRALVVATARFYDDEAKQQLGKLGNDDRVVAAWREELAGNAKLEYEVRGLSLLATFEALTAANTKLDDRELAVALERCATEANSACVPFFKRQPRDRVLAVAKAHAGESWAERAREVVAQSTGERRRVVEILHSLAMLDEPARRRTGEYVPSPLVQDEPGLRADFDALVDELSGYDKPIVPKLRKALASQSLYSARAAALVLAKLDRALLVKDTSAALARYDEVWRRKAASADVRFEPSGLTAAAGLRALMEVPGQPVDLVLLRALSALDPNVPNVVIDHLTATLTVDQAVDALFSFMAKKNEFMVAELEMYEKLVTSYGTAASAPLARNLERQLAKYRDPAKLDWALKLVTLRALGHVGTADAAPTVKKLTTDQSEFIEMEREQLSQRTVEAKHVAFAVLAMETFVAVSGRERSR